MIDERNRIEIMLNSIATATPIDDPRDRLELFISAIAEVLSDASTTLTLEPRDRTELLLNAIAEAISTAGLITTESLSVTENGTYTAASGHAYTPVVVNVAVPENVYVLKSATAGSTVTFSDGADAPLNELIADITPVQNLHGYDKPWAAGAGKNKLPLVLSTIKTINTDGTWTDNSYLINGVTFAVMTDNAGNVTGVNVNGTATADVNFKVYDASLSFVETGTKTLSGCPNGGGDDTYSLGLFRTSQTTIRDTGSGISYGYLEPVRHYVFITIKNGVTADNLDFTPMIEDGDTKTAFAPYSNICPISPYTDVDITANSGTITISLGDSVYGGSIDVTSGVITITDGNIASYDGETLPSTWISSLDEYAAGTTPTTGAQVVYKLASSQTSSINPTLIRSATGSNSISANSGNITSCEYFSK